MVELQTKFATPRAKHLLKQATYTLDDLENFFLNERILQDPRSTDKLSTWLDGADQCFEIALMQRKFCEGILEKFGPRVVIARNR